MTKLALAVAAAALAFVATPASAQHHGHAHRSHAHVHHVHGHHSHHRHYGHHHVHKPVHYGHTYSAPVYVKPHVVTAYAPTNCFWAIQKHGYEHRKVWVCKPVEYKTVEHVKPEVKVVEVTPAPAEEVSQK